MSHEIAGRPIPKRPPNLETGNTSLYDVLEHIDFTRKAELKPAIEANPGLQAREAAIRAAFDDWWQAHGQRISELASAAN